MSDQEAEELLKVAEERLVAVVPPAVKALNISEPVYCLRVWYFEEGDEEYITPALLLPREATRKRFLAEYGNKVPHYLWCADELTGTQTRAYRASLSDPELSGALRRWYERLGSVEGIEDKEDAEKLLPVRLMVQRAAARLNAVPWADYAPVTDDFVVFAADGAHAFLDDEGDMTASVPAERIELLKARGYIGRNSWYTVEE